MCVHSPGPSLPGGLAEPGDERRLPGCSSSENPAFACPIRVPATPSPGKGEVPTRARRTGGLKLRPGTLHPCGRQGTGDHQDSHCPLGSLAPVAPPHTPNEAPLLRLDSPRSSETAPTQRNGNFRKQAVPPVSVPFLVFAGWWLGGSHSGAQPGGAQVPGTEQGRGRGAQGTQAAREPPPQLLPSVRTDEAQGGNEGETPPQGRDPTEVQGGNKGDPPTSGTGAHRGTMRTGTDRVQGGNEGETPPQGLVPTEVQEGHGQTECREAVNGRPHIRDGSPQRIECRGAIKGRPYLRDETPQGVQEDRDKQSAVGPCRGDPTSGAVPHRRETSPQLREPKQCPGGKRRIDCKGAMKRRSNLRDTTEDGMQGGNEGETPHQGWEPTEGLGGTGTDRVQGGNEWDTPTQGHHRGEQGGNEGETPPKGRDPTEGPGGQGQTECSVALKGKPQLRVTTEGPGGTGTDRVQEAMKGRPHLRDGTPKSFQEDRDRQCAGVNEGETPTQGPHRGGAMKRDPTSGMEPHRGSGCNERETPTSGMGPHRGVQGGMKRRPHLRYRTPQRGALNVRPHLRDRTPQRFKEGQGKSEGCNERETPTSLMGPHRGGAIKGRTHLKDPSWGPGGSGTGTGSHRRSIMTGTDRVQGGNEGETPPHGLDPTEGPGGIGIDRGDHHLMEWTPQKTRFDRDRERRPNLRDPTLRWVLPFISPTPRHCVCPCPLDILWCPVPEEGSPLHCNLRSVCPCPSWTICGVPEWGSPLMPPTEVQRGNEAETPPQVWDPTECPGGIGTECRGAMKERGDTRAKLQVAGYLQAETARVGVGGEAGDKAVARPALLRAWLSSRGLLTWTLLTLRPSSLCPRANEHAQAMHTAHRLQPITQLGPWPLQVCVPYLCPRDPITIRPSTTTSPQASGGQPDESQGAGVRAPGGNWNRLQPSLQSPVASDTSCAATLGCVHARLVGSHYGDPNPDFPAPSTGTWIEGGIPRWRGGRLRGMGQTWGVGAIARCGGGGDFRVRRSLLLGVTSETGPDRRCWGAVTGRGRRVGGVGLGFVAWPGAVVVPVECSDLVCGGLGHWVWRPGRRGSGVGRPLPPRLSRQAPIGSVVPTGTSEQQEPQPEGPRLRREEEGRARTRGCAGADAGSAQCVGKLALLQRLPRRKAVWDWAAACCRLRCCRGSPGPAGRAWAAWLERLTGWGCVGEAPTAWPVRTLRRVRVAAEVLVPEPVSCSLRFLVIEKDTETVEDGREVLDLERSLEEGTRDRETRHGPEVFPGVTPETPRDLEDRTMGITQHWAKKRTQVTKMDVAPAPRHTRPSRPLSVVLTQTSRLFQLLSMVLLLLLCTGWAFPFCTHPQRRRPPAAPHPHQRWEVPGGWLPQSEGGTERPTCGEAGASLPELIPEGTTGPDHAKPPVQDDSPRQPLGLFSASRTFCHVESDGAEFPCVTRPLGCCAAHTSRDDCGEHGRYWSQAPERSQPTGDTSCGEHVLLKDSTYLAQTPPLCPKGQDGLKLFWDPRVVTEAWKLGQNTPLFLLGVSCRRGIWFKEMSQATRGALQLGTAGPLCLHQNPLMLKPLLSSGVVCARTSSRHVLHVTELASDWMHRLVVTSDFGPLPIPGSAHAPNGLQKPGGGQRGPGGTAHLCWEDRGALQNCAGRTRMRCRTVMEEALQICPGRTRVHWRAVLGDQGALEIIHRSQYREPPAPYTPDFHKVPACPPSGNVQGLLRGRGCEHKGTREQPSDCNKTVGLMTDQGRRAEPRWSFPRAVNSAKQTPARVYLLRRSRQAPKGWRHQLPLLRDRQQLRKPRSLHTLLSPARGDLDDHAHHFVPAGKPDVPPAVTGPPSRPPRPVSPGSQPPSGTPELSLFPQRSLTPSSTHTRYKHRAPPAPPCLEALQSPGTGADSLVLQHSENPAFACPIRVPATPSPGKGEDGGLKLRPGTLVCSGPVGSIPVGGREQVTTRTPTAPGVPGTTPLLLRLDSPRSSGDSTHPEKRELQEAAVPPVSVPFLVFAGWWLGGSHSAPSLEEHRCLDRAGQGKGVPRGPRLHGATSTLLPSVSGVQEGQGQMKRRGAMKGRPHLRKGPQGPEDRDIIELAGGRQGAIKGHSDPGDHEEGTDRVQGGNEGEPTSRTSPQRVQGGSEWETHSGTGPFTDRVQGAIGRPYLRDETPQGSRKTGTSRVQWGHVGETHLGAHGAGRTVAAVAAVVGGGRLPLVSQSFAPVSPPLLPQVHWTHVFRSVCSQEAAVMWSRGRTVVLGPLDLLPSPTWPGLRVASAAPGSAVGLEGRGAVREQGTAGGGGLPCRSWPLCSSLPSGLAGGWPLPPQVAGHTCPSLPAPGKRACHSGQASSAACLALQPWASNMDTFNSPVPLPSAPGLMNTAMHTAHRLQPITQLGPLAAASLRIQITIWAINHTSPQASGGQPGRVTGRRGQGARVGIGTASSPACRALWPRTLAVQPHTRPAPAGSALGSREESRGVWGQREPSLDVAAWGVGAIARWCGGGDFRVRRSLLLGVTSETGPDRRCWGAGEWGWGLWPGPGPVVVPVECSDLVCGGLGHWVWRPGRRGSGVGRPLPPPLVPPGPDRFRSSLLATSRAAGAPAKRAALRREEEGAHARADAPARTPDRPSAGSRGGRRSGDWAAACCRLRCCRRAGKGALVGACQAWAAWLERLTGWGCVGEAPTAWPVRTLRRVRVAAEVLVPEPRFFASFLGYREGHGDGGVEGHRAHSHYIYILAERLLHSQGAEDRDGREVLDLERSLEEGTRDRETRHGPEVFPGVWAA
ncbi:hypothetical protein Cadr_000021627 [Camelus dromedarius]|uniref:Uncharacterized protein n=1 Tax=Camelus dromedarius TaxID=9838 RepID=A0A5N4CSZ8_CAMDR|nr:hypothetical protein Cadr_000021627 [Camelus dromedarius]